MNLPVESIVKAGYPYKRESGPILFPVLIYCMASVQMLLSTNLESRCVQTKDWNKIEKINTETNKIDPLLICPSILFIIL